MSTVMMPVFCSFAFAEGFLCGRYFQSIFVLIAASLLLPFVLLYGAITTLGDTELQMWKPIVTAYGGLIVSPIALLGAWVGRVLANEALKKVTALHE